VFKKVAPPPKNFWNIFTSVQSFCVKFCKFVANSYPHISANFCGFMLIFDQMVSQKIFGGYFLLKYPVGQIQSSTTKRTAALLSL